nr:hypothetical protein [Deltaproteobacteria bacterium]
MRRSTEKMVALVVLSLGGTGAACKRTETATAAPVAAPTQPQLPMQPPAAPITWAANATRFRPQAGAMLTFQCPPNGEPGTVWGSDTYSDDSSICTAAAHSGRITRAAGGVVQIQIAPGQPSYPGTMRAGETTRHFGAFPGSFTIVGGPQPGLVAVPVPQLNGGGVNIGGVQIRIGGGDAGAPNPWSAKATSHRGNNGSSFTQECPPNGTLASVWGTDVYTDDSSICSAAVHVGQITLAQGGRVTVFVHPGQPSYAGSARSGVTSMSFASFPGSFAFTSSIAPTVRAPEGVEAITWAASATRFRTAGRARQEVWCPPGGRPGTVWGRGPFTDDSSICTAAVFAGRITFEEGGVVRLRPKPGRAHYEGDTRNGVTTRDYAGVVPTR